MCNLVPGIYFQARFLSVNSNTQQINNKLEPWLFIKITLQQTYSEDDTIKKLIKYPWKNVLPYPHFI